MMPDFMDDGRTVEEYLNDVDIIDMQREIDEYEEWPDDECYALGHDDEVTYEDEYGYDWRCRRCGAEGTVEND